MIGRQTMALPAEVEFSRFNTHDGGFALKPHIVHVGTCMGV